MAVPNIDPKAFLEALFGEPQVMLDKYVGMAVDALGPAGVQNLEEQFGELVELLKTQPGQAVEPTQALLRDALDGMGMDRLEEILRSFMGEFPLTPPLLDDFLMVGTIMGNRIRVKDLKDIKGFGRAYTFFRQGFASNGMSLWRAMDRRRNFEGEDEQHQYNMEDLELLIEYIRSMDGEPSFVWSRRLMDVWWRVYERPVSRVCLLLWYWGQEVRSPDNTKEPPVGQVGELFSQARRFTEEDLVLTFPFRPDLNDLRNSLHKRQSRIDAEYDVEFRDRHGRVLANLQFDELADAVWDDAEFGIYADQALQLAMFASLDARGAFDRSWTNVCATLSERGINVDAIARIRR